MPHSPSQCLKRVGVQALPLPLCTPLIPQLDECSQVKRHNTSQLVNSKHTAPPILLLSHEPCQQTFPLHLFLLPVFQLLEFSCHLYSVYSSHSHDYLLQKIHIHLCSSCHQNNPTTKNQPNRGHAPKQKFVKLILHYTHSILYSCSACLYSPQLNTGIPSTIIS